VYLEQYQRAINRVTNSAANPLPTREKPRRIPLPDGFSRIIQSLDLTFSFGDGGARLRPKTELFSCRQGKCATAKKPEGAALLAPAHRAG
jgi:hypothetical protein